MGYDNIHRITSKSQHLTQNNVQFNGTLNVGYDLTYTYGTEAGKKFQLTNVKDVNYRTEQTPGDNKIENNHVYLYDKNGVRCWVGFDGRPQEEYEKTGKVVRKNGDVTDRIPRDKDGKLDLMAEEPIIISIVPIEGISLTGHACMQYKDRVVNRVLTMDTDPIYPRYQDLSDYYFIYPSQVGIDPKKLIREIDRHNILHGDEPYNIFTNNCAKNVADVLKKLGVKDINFIGPDKVVSYPTPGNNPFSFGVEDWCMRHGVPVTQEEIATLCQYHEVPDLDKRNKWQEDVRNRYKQYKDYIINEQTQSKLSKLRKKVAHTTDKVLHTETEKKKIPTFAKYIEQKVSDTVLGKEK